MAYDLNAIKKKLKEFGGSKLDPDEFRPGKAKVGEKLKYRFFILPGLLDGDKLKSGVVEKSMDLFFVNYGQHWIKNQPHSCPRVYDNSECEICDFGLKLLRDKTLGDTERQKIRQDWLPNSNFVVNIFFPNIKTNPEDLRGKVMYYKAPKTLFDIWTACINREEPEEINDDEEFEPHGIFFDENASWMFELQVELNGKSNGYKTSRFVFGSDKKPVPIAKNEDGSANTKQIANILAQRIDIWDRLEAPDRLKIKKLSQVLIHGDDEDEAPPAKNSGFDVDEEDEKPVKKAKEADVKAKTKPSVVVEEVEDDEPPAPKAKKASPPPFVDETEDDDDAAELSSLLDQLDDD